MVLFYSLSVIVIDPWFVSTVYLLQLLTRGFVLQLFCLQLLTRGFVLQFNLFIVIDP